jgi:hypothetical protein
MNDFVWWSLLFMVSSSTLVFNSLSFVLWLFLYYFPSSYIDNFWDQNCRLRTKIDELFILYVLEMLIGMLNFCVLVGDGHAPT